MYRSNSLKASLNLRVEVTEGGGSMRIDYRWINRWIVIIDIGSRCGLIDQTIFQHVLGT